MTAQKYLQNATYLQDAELVVVGPQQAHQAALEVAELLVGEVGQQALPQAHEGDEARHVLDGVLHEEHQQALHLDRSGVLGPCGRPFLWIWLSWDKGGGVCVCGGGGGGYSEVAGCLAVMLASSRWDCRMR